MLAARLKYPFLVILVLCPLLLLGETFHPLLSSSKLPISWMNDMNLEKLDICWQAFLQGVANSDPKTNKVVFTLNQNLADVSSAKVLPGLKRHGVKTLFLVDSSSILYNENVLRSIVEQGHYVALKNLSEDTSREEIIEDCNVYYRVLEQAPLLIAHRSSNPASMKLPITMIPIYVGKNDGKTISLEREGDLDDAISQVLDSSSIVSLEKMMSFEQLKCTYQKLGCHSSKTRQSLLSSWCNNIEEELITRYISFTQYVSSRENIKTEKIKEWLNNVQFFVQRNSKQLESLYEAWRYADTATDSISVIHLWPKRRIPPIISLNSSCVRKSLQSYTRKSKSCSILNDIHLLIDMTVLLVILTLSFWFRRKQSLIKKQD